MKIIDEDLINEILHDSKSPNAELVDSILNKALLLNGLELHETATLLNIEDDEQLEKLFAAALKAKQEIYGNRLVLFAPLYISNYCSNNCLYCGFRAENKDIIRTTLNLDDIKEETISILEQGHKRILLLMGEHIKHSTIDFLIDAIKAIYSVKDSKGNSIRRINVEIAPLHDDEFKRLNEVPLGTYTVFQETYHRETYKKMHPSGPKADYDFRIETMDRALANGMHDVGIGALFGLYDYRFEVLGLIQHAKHLDKKFNVGPHTISIPRIYHAQNAPYSEDIPHKVTDRDFKKLVAVIRLSVPYTGMILSTREPVELRTEIFALGISQLSAGSRTNPGGYKQAFNESADSGQFSLNDCRSSGEVIQDLIKHNYIPSFCTACYRLGRIGEDFMDLAKPGLIKLNCQPNALMTLKEYLVDYADDETIKAGNELIERELNEIPNEARKQKTIENLNDIENGVRDIYF
jgi:2-iminoacetate synthase